MNMTDLVHIYTTERGECVEGARPPMPEPGATTWVSTPHEPDPRQSTVPESWHEASECPFGADSEGSAPASG